VDLNLGDTFTFFKVYELQSAQNVVDKNSLRKVSSELPGIYVIHPCGARVASLGVAGELIANWPRSAAAARVP
jgi:hypothetical protein